MRRALIVEEGGISICSVKINNLRYADDIAIFPSSVEELRNPSNKLTKVSHEFGLRININKTKIMIVDRDTESTQQELDGYEIVDEFEYLGVSGSTIKEDQAKK